MKGNILHRPGPDGRQRTTYVGRKGRDRILPNVRWRSEDGLVHQAADNHNRTLCEMGSSAFIKLLHEHIVENTLDRVDCVACIGYVTWPEYPID